MIRDLMTVASAMGPRIESVMYDAVQDGKPRGGGCEETVRYFGDNLEAAHAICAPVVVALDGMIPGFKGWIEFTGFADDKLMMVALMNIAHELAKRPRPADARMRPDHIPAPRFM